MADRLLVFANPEVRDLLKERFVAVTGDDWYQRRKKGAEGAYFQKIVKQGPRKGDGTRQGHYVFTAQGKLLGFNNNRGAERRLAMMREALEKFEALPEAERIGGITENTGAQDDQDRELPEGGQIIEVLTRALAESDDGLVSLGSETIGNQTAVDHLWLRKKEIAELRELVAKGGGAFPDWFAMRMARFHLRDNTRGEPENWDKANVKDWELSVDAKGNVRGHFELQKKEGELGFEGDIRGEIAFGNEGNLSELTWIVLGWQWGEGTFTGGARPGKTALGQIFRLTAASEPRDRIPPQGIRWERGYWQAQD